MAEFFMIPFDVRSKIWRKARFLHATALMTILMANVQKSKMMRIFFVVEMRVVIWTKSKNFIKLTKSVPDMYGMDFVYEFFEKSDRVGLVLGVMRNRIQVQLNTHTLATRICHTKYGWCVGIENGTTPPNFPHFSSNE